ncbi:MAG: type II toxin-antitoxin system VapC family toxin [Proteobacteria bacterium]|nr:type II toxin-antitoxin system VapC family toxin [Pseudomonadota bacterium]MBU4470059.1 type II toxin-antitoxin system VapC family toxin [Pseudomonadota bacterium]MCG2750704.1 type II toxin-antitoxin system VapC family toxin [Desulfobacteraceae bacterium]
MFFLDTNTCIFYLNGTSPAVKGKILATSPAQIKICSMVKAELLFGAYKSRQKQSNLEKVAAFLEPFEIIPFDDQAAYVYADIRSKTETTGRNVGPNDLLIAAVVLFHNGMLITNNVIEFSRIDDLKIEDWSKIPPLS